MGLFKNKMLVGVAMVVVVGGLLYFWSRGSSSPTLTDNTASPLSSDLLTTLGSLSTIRLDETLFTDPAFASLTDFGVTIPPQATGRRNPFAPL